MNQDNNIIGYDSQTGQQITANQNINKQNKIKRKVHIIPDENT